MTDTMLDRFEGELPEAGSLAHRLRAQLDAAVLAERQRRGPVVAREDVYPMMRNLGAVVDAMREYEYAFRTVRGTAAAIAEEELADAVGEQDGVPNESLRVPDEDGSTLLVTLDRHNVYDFDMDSLISAIGCVTAMTQRHRMEEALESDSISDALTEVALYALESFLGLGKFQPQISKVRQFKSWLSEEGEDHLASTIVTHKTTRYDGVQVKREFDKESSQP